MKKNNLFKVVGIVILGYILLSWIVPIIASICGETETLGFQIGFVNTGLKLVETFSGFGNNLVFILLVGGFYAILEKTGVYDKSLSLIVDKIKDRKKLFLIAIIVLMAIISSITGLELGLLIVFPFVISIILMMGYDKLVALASTFGSTIIGMYGATVAGTLYGVNSSMLGISATSEILAKIILFVLGLGLLIAFILFYIKKDNDNKRLDSQKEDKKKVKLIVKNPEAKIEEKSEGKKYVWPIYVVLGLLFLVFILGTTSWGNIFKTNWFLTAHESIMGWNIKDFAPVSAIFGGMEAFGTWSAPTRFQYYSVLLIFASVLLCIFYKVKLSDAFEAFVKGIKEYMVPAVLALLAYSVFVFTFYYPVLSYLTNLLTGLTDTFNIAISGLYSIISSVFYADYYYYAYYVLYSFSSTVEDSTMLPLVDIIFTNLYALVMLIGPTSVLLLTSLSITEVSYKTWIKFIWKLFLSLLIVSFIVFIIMLLI